MQISQEKSRQPTEHNNSTPQSALLEIDREFNVSVDHLFAAFSYAEALKIWWWPKNLYADRIQYDFREGGKFFINMKGWKHEGGMTGKFEKIVENELIVMSDQFADGNGKPISAKEAQMDGVWPELIYITLEFKPLGKNKSKLHLAQEGIPNEMQQDCIQGWNESFDKLKDYLESKRH